jgi:hypothetical protein
MLYQFLLRLLHQPLTLRAIQARVLENGNDPLGDGPLYGIGRLGLDELNS